MRLRALRLTPLLALAMLFHAGPLAAQVGTTTDVLTGIVRDSAGQPVADAIVEATSLETQVVRTTRTDPRGRYTLLFPDGGGQYRLIVRAIGKTPVMRTIARVADEDRLVTNVTLGTVATRLEEIVVRGRTGPPPGMGGDGPPTPGSTERAIPADRAARLPLDASDLTILATLAPGVVSVSGSDTTAAGFSVAGQRPTSNSTTLDGLTFGGASVPQDAVRNTRVITNSYDVARGQFSGGQVATTTRSGTNRVQGTANYSLRDRDLSVSAGDSSAFAQGFTQHQLSAGFGGPLLRNKIFYFLSGQGRLRDDGLQTLLSATPANMERLGLSPDSATRFLGFLDASGLPLYSEDTTANRSTNNWSALTRFDFLLSQNQTLSLRGDWRESDTKPTGVGTLSVPSAGGTTRSSGGGLMATLSSRFGTKLLSEFRAYASGTSNDGHAFNEIPQGRVQVVSALDNGSQTVSNLSFGGNSGLSQKRSSRDLELTEELSLIPGNATHRVKVGALYSRSASKQVVANNLTGTFTYQSLADLYAGTPSSFTRTLQPSDRSSTSVNAALYFGDTWRYSDALQLTYGGRLERSQFSHAPAYNPVVEQVFGFRTDRLPSETHFSPRVGFTYTVSSGAEQPAPPLFTIRGGFGEFRSPIPVSLASSAQSATGLSTAETQLVCIGSNVPVPDWDAYLANPASIPSACTGGSGSQLPTTSPQVTVFDPAFGAPRALRGSFGIQHRTGTWTLGVDLSWARGLGQSGYTDQNLGASRFTLANEGGRNVFVPGTLIDPTSGQAPLAGSRKDTRFGQVLLMDSKLKSSSKSATFSANGVTRGGIALQASYTWSRSRDQASGGGFGGGGFAGQTAGLNPNEREWATSDFERRHSFLAVVTWPATAALEVTGIARMTSGSPYTPGVGGDINGDGSRNDRAFIFNPATTADTAIANGMTRLLGSVSGGAKACLEKQMGGIATRNSCLGPWQPSLDLQLNYRPAFAGLNRRLTISLVTQNMLAGVDQLFHGASGLHGWGQTIRPNTTLLSVRGFDPLTSQFKYTVNERFGATSVNTTAIRNPFQVGIQLRYQIGVAGFAGMLAGGGFGGGGGGGFAGRGAVGGGPGGFGGGAPGAGGDFTSRFASLIPNPIKEMLDLKVGLRLTDEQEAKLKALSDTLTAQNTRLAKELQDEIAKMGANADGGRMMTVIRPRMEAGQKHLQEALDAVKALLTTEQWNYLPERLRTPRGFGAGRQGGERRPPGETM